MQNARGANNMMNGISETSNTREPTGTASVVKRKRQGHPLKIPSLHRLGALIRKNYLISFRNIGYILHFLILLAVSL
jgi:hypothetical protein